MTERTGGCLCGQVRYRLKAEPLAARIGWCKDCTVLERIERQLLPPRPAAGAA
jgi:hypothetical protein